MTEEWKTLIYKDKEYADFLISNTGKVYNKKLNILKKTRLDKLGFLFFSIGYKNKDIAIYLHRAVAEHFLPNPNHYTYVIFKNGKQEDCSVNNLLWSPTHPSHANRKNRKYLPPKELTEKEKLLREKNYKKSFNKREEAKLKAIEYMGNKCQICGYSKQKKNLECHHVDPDKKEFQISELYTKSWEVIQTELDKCVLVCSNCHREIHAGITPCPELIHKKK